jgi:uncharacterized protein YacL
MKHMNRRAVIIAIIVGTPILCTLCGALTTAIHSKDQEGIGAAFGLVFGVFGSILGLILGPIVSHSMRHMENQKYSLIGYIIPPVGVFLYLLVLGLTT